VSTSPHNFEDAEIKQQVAKAVEGISDDVMEQLAAAPPPEKKKDHHDHHEQGKIRGVILDVRGTDVYINIGGKSEGILPLDDFPPGEPPRMGKVIEVTPRGLDPESGLMRLSFGMSRQDADLSQLKVGDVVKGKVTGTNVGGLELKVNGVRGFMPKSQVAIERIEDFSPFLNHWLECEVTELNRRGKSIVLSRRRLLEREREHNQAEAMATIQVGDTRKGTVRRLADFGAFVDIGGVEGLLHVSDMSYAHVNKPSEILKEGDEIEVKVLRLEPERGRISLGLKQLSPDPWTTVTSKYSTESTVSGKVTKLMNFGAFVQLEEGIEGLIPISEMSWTQHVTHPKNVLNVGDDVRVSVLKVDPDNRKISLSLKALSEDPWTTITDRYQPDTKVSGAVTRVVDFGAFVQLEEGVEGLIHVSELSDSRIRHPGDVVKPGQVVEARVLQVDPEQRRIGLSLKSGVSAATEGGHSAQGASDAAPAKPKKRKKPLRGGLE
ncbi:MAG: S1 RNA-binding domain-containing protein, partial [Phycisphaerae bacterium]